MNPLQNSPFRFRTALMLIALCFACAAGAIGAPSPWWDVLPLGISTSDTSVAAYYHANNAMNGVGNDPGWGNWFTDAGGAGTTQAQTRQSFANLGIKSICYNESYGDAAAPIVSVGTGYPLPISCSYWGWQYYNGTDSIKWAGAATWFDDLDYARPYTRTDPTYGGSPMTYPDGTVATGFFNNDPTDPRNSRVYDAGCSADIFGNVHIEDYGYVTGPVHTGCFNVSGNWAGCPWFGKDTACPCWADYARASAKFVVAKYGTDGSWTDNFGTWNNFSYWDGAAAYGKWSVAGFPTYLQNHFTVGQLISMGVLGSSQTYADLAAFDVRAYLKSKASSSYGWDGVSIQHTAWANTGWLNDPVWSAYKIFKRQTGTQGLSDYYNAVKLGAAQAGKSDFLLMGNAATMDLGWLRGSLDMASTEQSYSWNLASGSRGFTLPPYGRLTAAHKLLVECTASRFAGVWLYNDGYTAQMALAPVVNASYYEMLATHVMPQFFPDNSSYPGTPTVNEAFFRFVADTASPEIGLRTPVQDVGIYCSTSTLLYQWLPSGYDYSYIDNQPHQFALWGWGTALTELHYQFRMLPEWKLNNASLIRSKCSSSPTRRSSIPPTLPRSLRG